VDQPLADKRRLICVNKEEKKGLNHEEHQKTQRKRREESRMIKAFNSEISSV
jgi:hypothetical protein